jgi:osmoprotectant transport system permease protein
MLSRWINRSLLVLLCALAPMAASAADSIAVGSKRFTESYILGEIITQTLTRAGEARAEHKQGLGNTAIVFAALKSGAIQVYPEYTGTIAFELLGLKKVPALAELNTLLAAHGLAAGVPLGFGNTYALAMSESRAAALGIRNISDLARHPELKFGLSQEFLNRKDGWPALREAYGLAAAPTGLDHGLAYDAVRGGRVEVIDIYATDARIQSHNLRVLADDRAFFPPYAALLIYRKDLPERFARGWQALQKLEGTISPERMTAMNGQAELDRLPFAQVAGAFLSGDAKAAHRQQTGWLGRLFGDDFWRLTLQHMLLVFASLALSVAVGVPLGIWAARSSAMRQPVLGFAGVLQTIPSLALLAFLIAALDRIGTAPAIIALFLYGLLPVVGNTETGLAGVSGGMRQAGLALGFESRAVLRLIELPLAAPAIVAGIKTSAVINVGTATIAAFIGAGGYGERIVAGLAVNDHGLMLAGAVPAAGLALLIQAGFGAVERKVLFRGLESGRK